MFSPAAHFVPVSPERQVNVTQSLHFYKRLASRLFPGGKETKTINKSLMNEKSVPALLFNIYTKSTSDQCLEIPVPEGHSNATFTYLKSDS
jgi:hypothetical protein